jgi:hypothetical protein
MQEQRAAE